MKLILNGGGSGTKIASSYKKFVELLDKTKPVLYVPIAMAGNPDHPYSIGQRQNPQ